MFKRTMCKMICFMILASFFLQNNASSVYADSGQLDVWVVNAMKAVYRTSTIPANPGNSIDLVSTRNEYESEQIAVRSNSDFEITGIEFSDLESSGNTISNSNLSYHFEEYVLEDTVQPNQYRPDLVGTQIYPLSEIPDPLSNDPSIHVAANSTQPILITNYVPADAAPGLYHGMVTVKSTSGDYQVPINVEVVNAEIPQTSKANFVNYQWSMTNGFMIGGSPPEIADDPLTQSSYDVGQNYYGVETYSDKWFELMDNFAKTMSDYRQNMIWVRTDLLLNAKGTKMVSFKDGIPEHIDWSLFDRYVQTFMDRGITHFANIHLIHALEQMPQSERPNNDNPEDPWKTSIPEPGSLPVTDAYLTNYLTALHDHLEDKGWLNDNGFTWYQHTKDEPNGASITNYMTYIARQLKEIVPDFKTLDADAAGTLMNEAIKPYVDVWVPLTPVFQDKKNLYKAEQAAGKDLWVYTCDANPAPWLNRFWTQPILTGRLLFWNLSQDDVQGHLHWGWNVWYVQHYGDSTIVYPDKDHMTVKSSLRYEAQRDGLEDYELMYQIKQTNSDLATRIADSAVSPSDPRKYTLDPEYIRMLHNYLVKAAAGEPVGAIPVPSSPYDGQDVPMTYMTDNATGEITFNGEWFAKSRKYAYMGGVQGTLKAEDDLTYTFTGSGIDLIAEKNEGSGKIAVSVDDSAPVIIDLYEKVQLDSISVYSNHNLSTGKHTIKVVNQENKNLFVDGFRVSMYEGQMIYDGTLQSLEMTNAPSVLFNKNNINYQAIIPNDVDVITITPTLADANGTLEVNGQRFGSGKRLTFNIPTGKSKILIRSTASDGETTRLYTLNFLKGNVNQPTTNIARSYSDITATAARAANSGYGASNMVDGSYGSMFASLRGYNTSHPFPHQINLTWEQKQTFNTIVMATTSGLIQGISNIDVQASTDGVNFVTIAKGVPLQWKSSIDDNVMEYTFANIPEVRDALKLRIQINDANYTTWGMYAVYELELYNLTESGEIGANTHTITASAEENGTISPNGAVVVNKGADQTFTFNPDNGYEIDEMRLDGTAVTVTGSVYTVANITADHMINVTFKRKVTGGENSNTITASAGENGTISPNGAVVVNDGADQTFTFHPSNGYEIDKVRLDGTAVTVTGSVYTVANITADHMINVTFKRKVSGGENSNPPTGDGRGTVNGNTDAHTLVLKTEDLTTPASNGVVTIIAKDKEKMVLPANAAELLGP
ncbi:glycoside hydrolase domain-containing protein [Paenibacillus alginolyticus]|uniref:DUF4091 domain-containing protein n=1 Tax=Paenibacillus alginolyticus TaxID=59839 RepID=A0ABT4GLZ8_9BACL|nr:glycoside hydrolase domain-containing protein [Paenibacillus alginolyticus]MCY9697238.1 DUF4091 domain-containing protein [Paenibacillus alginolyticus]